MIIEQPSGSVDRLRDNEPKIVQVPTYKPKAIFQWPPDCLWPFMDDGSENDT
jgi:hypothetical protein